MTFLSASLAFARRPGSLPSFPRALPSLTKSPVFRVDDANGMREMACYWRPQPRSAAPQSADRGSQVDLYGQAHAPCWPLLWCRSHHCGRDWLASQTRYARGSFSRRALHASGDSPCHSSAQPPPLEGLSPSHGAFQGHAAHLAEWSATLRPKGSWGTGIPHGVPTFFHTAFTAHSDAGAEAIGGRLHCFVQVSRSRGSHETSLPSPVGL